jgi:hypothetical protein
MPHNHELYPYSVTADLRSYFNQPEQRVDISFHTAIPLYLLKPRLPRTRTQEKDRGLSSHNASACNFAPR